MGDVTVPTVPALATIPGVELVQAGQWNISTGMVTFTSGDLASAVAALDCPAVRRPVLKLGHDEPDPGPDKIRWDGEPAVGYIDNMLLADGGNTIVGDYAGMPGWLGEVAASAYPDRSIEGWFDWQCQLGHTHPFVITAVALLGVQLPGVGTLQSLQDVASLYGVAAAADPVVGERVAVTVHASKGDGAPMPNPRPLQIAATVTSEDVRREYYNDASWEVWICEIQLDPLQLITVDDNTGGYARVPITLSGDAVTFGAPVPVRIQYVDIPQPSADTGTPAAASAGRIVFASRAESRPGERPTPPVAASQTPPAAPAAEDTKKEGAAMDAAKLREALGLSPEATDEEVTEALAANGLGQPAEPVGDPDPTTEGEGAPADPPASASLPDGIVTIDADRLRRLEQQASEGVAARAQQRTEARDRDIDAAINAGKFAPARREHFQKLYDADPDGTRATLASLSAGTVPVEDVGAPGGEPTGDPLDAEIDRLFRPTARQEV